jgi:hypothetical protein
VGYELGASARQLNRRIRNKPPADFLVKRAGFAQYPHVDRHSPMREQEEQRGDQQPDVQYDFSSYG